MHIHAEQLAVWERRDLQSWLSRSFPERVVGRSSADITAYLDDRSACARALRFTTSLHLRHLIGYELGCGIPWMPAMVPADPTPCSPWSRVIDLLRRVDTDPDARIAAVERLLYGRSDD